MDLAKGYAVVDLEMTGGDCWTDLIIEIAVGIARPGQNFQSDRVLVKIEQPLNPKIIELTGITDRELALSGIAIDAALAWFVERTDGLPLVGHDVFAPTALSCWKRPGGTGGKWKKADTLAG